MADVQPLRALHYDLATTGGLGPVLAPPYDVIDPEQREELAARSPYNVVRVDLPDSYPDAARLLQEWQAQGALVRDDEPALWVLEQRFTGPDGAERTRRGILARVRVEDYGAGRIRPHERTHPGPKEDRLQLTRATRANLSPIFALHGGDAVGALGDLGLPWAQTDDLTVWRIADPAAIEAAVAVFADAELLIADGHHRYETARAYAEEVGGEGPHRYVLMNLVSLEDPGLAIFPTHRLVQIKEPAKQEALAATLREHFDIEPVELDELRPPDGEGPLVFGYIDAHFKQAFRCTLKDPSVLDDRLPPALRSLDTAALETLILTGPLGLSEDDISHLRGLGYSRTDAEALQLVLDGSYDAAFFLRPSPVRQVQEIAAAGENMPPKSTFFHPKVPTGLLFNPLDETTSGTGVPSTS